jgi:hypothetical protein
MWRNNQGHANYIGDDAVAIAWAKHIIRMGHTCSIFNHNAATDIIQSVVIHFHHECIKQPAGAKQLLYVQNAWPVNHLWPSGTIGVYNDFKERFDGFIFPSEKMREIFKPDKPSCVIPFGADPELMYPDHDDAFAHPVCFVGNDIRPPEVTDKYLAPWLDKGLVIYGGPWRDERFKKCHRGRITDEQLRKVYSSAKLIVNMTHPEHKKHDVINERVYGAALCNAVMITDGEPERMTRADVLREHTYAHRMETLVKFLKGIL